MINGAHFLIYSKDAEADRAFFRDVLGFRSVDVGEGWLIFALPPAEIAVHPAGRTFAKRQGGHAMMGTVLYLMCGDLPGLIKSLKRKNVKCTEIAQGAVGNVYDHSAPERRRDGSLPADPPDGAQPQGEMSGGQTSISLP